MLFRSAVHGGFVQTSEGTSFNAGQKYEKAFFSTSYSVKDNSERTLARDFWGDLEWSHRGMEILPRTFRNALERLAAQTGLKEIVSLQIPSDITDRLDFTSISLRIRFKTEHAKMMVERVSSTPKDRILQLARKLGLELEPVCVGDDEFLCKANAMSAEANVNAMISSIESLGDAVRRADEKGATRAFARFGEMMFRNPAMFQLGLRLAGAGLPLDFVVEGADFRSFVSTMRTESSDGRFVPERRPRLTGYAEGTEIQKMEVWNAKLL